MNEHDRTTLLEAPGPKRPPSSKPDGKEEQPTRRGRSGRRLLALGALALIFGALGIGLWRHYTQNREVTATAEQRRDFVPTVRVEEVRANSSKVPLTLPATTEAFEAANIYARASGYIEKRYVDIGSKVAAGQLLAEIAAPELDHQVAQAQAMLLQDQAALRQAQANLELLRVTNDRIAVLTKQGWATQQEGDTNRLNYQAQKQAVGVAEANVQAQQAQLMVLQQEQSYLKVVAPFDGVVTQRNIDVGSLVQADAASGTALFAMTHSHVIRIWLYVPQDAAFGLGPNVNAVVRVPAMPGLTFPGKVTRLADALQPGTRTLLTEIDVPNPDGALTPGIYCTVQLEIPRKAPSLIVPADAIIFNRNGLHVAVVENGHAHIREITEVRDLGTEVEVSEGVKAGDAVILNPPVDLVDDAKVQIRPVPPDANP